MDVRCRPQRLGDIVLSNSLSQEVMLALLLCVHSRYDYSTGLPSCAIQIAALWSLLEEAVLQVARSLYSLHIISNILSNL